jgi:hypothetical protein
MLLEINNKHNIQKYLDFAEGKNLFGVTITCKKADEDILQLVENLKRITINIIPTFSITTEYIKTPKLTLQKLFEFEEIISKIGLEQALVVSGNPKRKLDTLVCLSELHKAKTKLKWGVAFNPFYPDIELEKNRLKQKLKYSFVNQVYLQLGENLDNLAASIEYIQSIQTNNLTIIGSVLIPSVSLLNQLNLRPWNGVYFSDKFLHDLEYAKECMQYYQKFLQQNHCRTLICGL